MKEKDMKEERIVTRRGNLRGGFPIGGFAACAAICVFALGISGCFTAADDSEADSSGIPGMTSTPLPFSGIDSSEEADSVIDLIKAAAGEDTLALLLTSQQEDVSLTAGTDLGTTGLVLRHSGDPETDTSPANVVINGGGRKIQLTGVAPNPGSFLITVGPGVTLTLRNITFGGISNNTEALIGVKGSVDATGTVISEANGGHLILEDDAAIRDNSGNYGGGVFVDTIGRFTMRSGIITGNTASFGGGVFLTDTANFTMEGGNISGNTASYGGGVIAMLASTFTMKNGTIANNQASAAEGNGGGIYVTLGSTFIMENGTVRGNSADSGGGVCIDRGSYFSKTGGIIYGGAAAGYYDTNTARSGAGHAVFVPEAGDGEFNSTADESVKLKWIPQAENETTE